MDSMMIGSNAGKVWRYLNSNGKNSTTKAIVSGTGLSRDDVCCAVGWLAREGKLDMQRRGKTKERLLQLTGL